MGNRSRGLVGNTVSRAGWPPASLRVKYRLAEDVVTDYLYNFKPSVIKQFSILSFYYFHCDPSKLQKIQLLKIFFILIKRHPMRAIHRLESSKLCSLCCTRRRGLSLPLSSEGPFWESAPALGRHRLSKEGLLWPRKAGIVEGPAKDLKTGENIGDTF